MAYAKKHKVHAIAQPRWCWSGAETLTGRLGKRKLALAARLLPRRQSSVKSLVRELLDLGAKYRRYLHQDEFGPTGAERMAAIRQLLQHLNCLSSELDNLPEHLHLQLHGRLVLRERSFPSSIAFQPADQEEILLEALYEAAVDLTLALGPDQDGGDADLMQAIGKKARHVLLLFSKLDTTTSADLITVSGFRPNTPDLDHSGAKTLGIMRARIISISRRLETTLSHLKRLRGPEPARSLTWLVWQLSDLWQRETGQLITSSALKRARYTSKPQSAGGSFVLAVVRGLRAVKGMGG
jgi:hypothetical protein